MTREMKVTRSKMGLLELAEYLQNVSEACRVMGVSRQHFHDIKQAYEEGGAEALREKSRRQPDTQPTAFHWMHIAPSGQQSQGPTDGQRCPGEAWEHAAAPALLSMARRAGGRRMRTPLNSIPGAVRDLGCIANSRRLRRR